MTSDEMVLVALRALCKFSVLVSQHNHSDLSLTALDDALKRFYKKRDAFWQLKMSKSAKAKVDGQLARDFHQLREGKIQIICAAMEVQVWGAAKVTTTRRRQFQVCLNRARQAATIWSEADWQTAQEQLVRKINQVTPAECKLCDELFQHHERQLLQGVETKAIGPRGIFTKKLTQMKTAEEE